MGTPGFQFSAEQLKVATETQRLREEQKRVISGYLFVVALRLCDSVADFLF